MASLNKVFLLGNLTRDPELRYTPGGAAVCEMGLAVSRRYTVNGQEQQEVCFVDIVVWGKSADNCKQYLEKGSPVLIEGRLQFDSWEDRNGGGKRSRLRVVADRVQFIGRRGEGAGEEAGAAPAQGAPRSYGRSQNSAPAMPQQPGSVPPPPVPDAFNPFDAAEDNVPF